jgi:hypothetical protein
MQDAITAVINSSDVQGKYLDISALDKLKNYFASGELRVRAATSISANAATIVKEAVAKSLLYSDVTRPGGNMYTTRRYAACIRDLDYYLRHIRHASWRPFHPRRARAQRFERNLQLLGRANRFYRASNPIHERSHRRFGRF